MKNLEKTYSPKDFENKIYNSWLEDQDFVAHINTDKKPYTIVIAAGQRFGLQNLIVNQMIFDALSVGVYLIQTMDL